MDERARRGWRGHQHPAAGGGVGPHICEPPFAMRCPVMAEKDKEAANEKLTPEEEAAVQWALKQYPGLTREQILKEMRDHFFLKGKRSTRSTMTSAETISAQA